MADRRIFWSGQGVKESELNQAFELLETADRLLSTDLALVGIVSGLGVTQAAIPNLNVQVAAGTAYDNTGQRIHLGNVVQLSCSVDEDGLPTAVSSPGNSRVLAVFIAFKRNQLVPKIDLEGDTVYQEQDESYELHVVAGAEAASSPTPPALRSGEKLICDITLTHSQTAIVNANISTTRKQWAFKTTSGTEIAVGTPMEAVQLLADAVGALVGIADNTAPDDGASRVGFDAITGGTYYNFTQGTLRTAMTSVHTHLNTEGAARVGVQTNLTTHINNTSGAHASSAISYANGPAAWKDTTGLSATDVQAALREILTSLAAAGGAARLAGAAQSGTPSSLTAGSIQAMLVELLGHVNGRARLASDEAAVTALYTFDGAGKGIRLKNGAGILYFATQTAHLYVDAEYMNFPSGLFPGLTIGFYDSYFAHDGVYQPAGFKFSGVPAGAVITALEILCSNSASGSNKTVEVRATAKEYATGGYDLTTGVFTNGGTGAPATFALNAGDALAWRTVPLAAGTHTVPADGFVRCFVNWPGNASFAPSIYAVRLTYTFTELKWISG